MDQKTVHIVGSGASTAIGRNAWSVAAAVRAGVSGFTQHPYFIDNTGEPIHAAIVPWLDVSLTGGARLAELLFPAIDQALAPLQSAQTRGLRVAFALGLPPARPGLENGIEMTMTDAISARFPRVFAYGGCFRNGHAAGLMGLAAALRTLESGAIDACVVAGADSYIADDTLEWLEESEQLHGAGTLNNAWGFVPGEGAGAVLLLREDTVEKLELASHARILRSAVALEAKKRGTKTVCIGEGLTQAFADALRGLPQGHQVTDLYCDMNGEPYRADEFGFTALRTKLSFANVSDFIAPADCWGDVGAAGAPLHLILAATAGIKGYSNGPLALVCASAEQGERAAVVLRVARWN